jgi:putative transposase
VLWKDRKAVCADLKMIYGAVNLDEAEYAKKVVREKWGKKYPSGDIFYRQLKIAKFNRSVL